MSFMRSFSATVNRICAAGISIASIAYVSLSESAGAAQSKSPLLATELKQLGLLELAAEAVHRGDAARGKAIFHREKLGCVKANKMVDIRKTLNPKQIDALVQFLMDLKTEK